MGYVVCQESDVKFDRFVVEDGLTSINCIVKDSKGFMWFGGTHGLYRYDGYEFRIFTNNPKDSNSISGNDIISIYPEENGFLWIGTSNNGLCLYNPEKENFIHFLELGRVPVTSIHRDHQGLLWVGTLGEGIYILDEKNRFIENLRNQKDINHSVSNNEVFDIYEDNKGRIWITSNSGSLDLYSRETKAFRRFIFKPGGYQSVRSGQIIFKDHQGYFWIGTEGDGLYRFDEKDNSFTHYLHSNNHPNSLSNNIITGMAEGIPGEIWITTDGGGLNLLNIKTLSFQHFRHNPLDPSSLINNSSYSIFIDKHQTMWLGMGDGIVNISRKSPFRIYQPTLSGINTISFRVVVALCLSSDNKIWIATGGGGIDVFDPETRTFKNFRHNPDNPNSISTDIVLSLCEDRNGNIWSGTLLGGVDMINPKTGKITHFRNHPDNSNSLINDHVFGIREDHLGNVWFATMGGGLDCYKQDENEFVHFTHTPGNAGLNSNKVRCLYQRVPERLWVGSDEGAQIIDPENLKFSEMVKHGLTDTIKNTAIHDIIEDRMGNVWFATNDMGLCRLNLETGKWEIFQIDNGMPSNSVYGVFEDTDGYIWSCTNKGIARYNPITQKILVLNIDDGLPTNDFEAGSIVQAKNGELYISSKKGLVSFFPGKLSMNMEEAEVILIGFRIFNELVNPGQSIENAIPLKSSISFTKEIVLPYFLNNFSFEFSAPGYQNPSKIRYQYRLDGADNRWIETGPERRVAPYSNLKPGDYTFRIRGASDTEVQNAVETIIRLRITPPFWKTSWAYLLYAIIAATGLIFIFKEYTNRVKLRHQLDLEKYKHEKDNELNLMKIGFFTNISHELRTPLTLILGPLDRMISTIEDNNYLINQLKLIQRNGQRLIHMVNQLLDFRKLESGKMQLQVVNTELTSFIHEIVSSFREMAVQKNIEFNIKLNANVNGYFDRGKVEIMIFNLLSNAFKFTSKNGKVQLEVQDIIYDGNTWLQIVVSDTGKGIHPEEINKVFEMFHQQNNNSGIKGTGIGLALTKSLAELHHGRISIESKYGEGTSFTIILPLYQNAYGKDEFLNLSSGGNEVIVARDHGVEHEKVISRTEKLPLLLVVEDNIDLNNFISDGFKNSYEILNALNGREAWDLAIEKIPDIVISDIMMPEMDGIELCRKLKMHIHTSHIPIILLTARSAERYELEGLETGADDYISKPFSFNILSARVNNLIEIRRQLQERFKREFILRPQELAITNPDEEFLKKLSEIMEDNISNTDLTVEIISREIGMSHSALYRKLLALTGKKISDFINIYRLQRAVQMLHDSGKTINEISDLTGFSNSKYFSTLFKKEYGLSPTDYKKKLLI